MRKVNVDWKVKVLCSNWRRPEPEDGAVEAAVEAAVEGAVEGAVDGAVEGAAEIELVRVLLMVTGRGETHVLMAAERLDCTSST